VKNREFFFDHTSKDTTSYDTRRRSLYLPVVRNHVYDMFQLYDFPNPAVVSGDRTISTVAPQALFMLNSELVWKASEELAGSLLAREADDVQRVQWLYERVLCRGASQQEIERSLAYLNQEASLVTGEEASTARLRAWRSLCQALLISNEFLTAS
jgi:hypothetical protein